jgi:hypothetical protein
MSGMSDVWIRRHQDEEHGHEHRPIEKVLGFDGKDKYHLSAMARSYIAG